MIEQYLLAALLLCVLVHLSYWLFLFSRLKSSEKKDFVDVSHDIVVCFKNEESNLPALIKNLSTQSCQSVVLVDDFSTDNSAKLVAESSPAKFQLEKASIDRPGKKAALLQGALAAGSECIVLTDADCRSATADWSQIMVNQLGDNDAVLGYGPMKKVDGFVATFSRYETYLTGIQYLSYAQVGIPYMGVGRNMAVRKRTALPVLQQMQGDQIASGDDDLLIQGLAHSGSVETCIDPRTFVYSAAPDSFSKYILQKSRHISTASSYKFVHRVLLAVFAGTHLLTYALVMLLLLFFEVSAFQLWLILGVKWLLQMAVNRKLMYLLDEKDLWWKFPILDIATFVFYMVLSPYLLFKNKTKWT